MKTIYTAIILVLVIIAGIGIYGTLNGGKSELEQACINSGGTVGTSSCCKSVNNFPNTCLIGACGCSLENSHEVKVCDCPEDKCFDGSTCT
jgi:hypothetical protein